MLINFVLVVCFGSSENLW